MVGNVAADNVINLKSRHAANDYDGTILHLWCCSFFDSQPL